MRPKTENVTNYNGSKLNLILFSESGVNRYSASKPQQVEAQKVNKKWISPEEQKKLICMDVTCDIQTNLDDHVTIICCSVAGNAKPTGEIITTSLSPPIVPAMATTSTPTILPNLPTPLTPTTPLTPQQEILIQQVCNDVVCNGKRTQITIICCKNN